MEIEPYRDLAAWRQMWGPELDIDHQRLHGQPVAYGLACSVECMFGFLNLISGVLHRFLKGISFHIAEDPDIGLHAWKRIEHFLEIPTRGGKRLVIDRRIITQVIRVFGGNFSVDSPEDSP